MKRKNLILLGIVDAVGLLLWIVYQLSQNLEQQATNANATLSQTAQSLNSGQTVSNSISAWWDSLWS
jgi:cytoskeletal protein RodZ